MFGQLTHWALRSARITMSASRDKQVNRFERPYNSGADLDDFAIRDV